MRNYNNLDIFLNERILDASFTYDYSDENNKRIAQIGIENLIKAGLKPGDKFIDIGCGNGRDLVYAKSKGLDVTGVNFIPENFIQCPDIGIPILNCDQSFLDVDNESFDCVYSRHCLEHSIMPYFTLTEYNRVLKTKGLCYVEIPAPDTEVGLHETNPNHYSLFGKRMWEELFERSGFSITAHYNIDFNKEDEDNRLIDQFWVYILTKETLGRCGWFRDHKGWPE